VKKILTILLALNAALLAGILLKEKTVVVHAAGGGGVPFGNGDVNGDGEYDISDAVYFLTWRYLGGTAPVPIEVQDQECQQSLADCGAALATCQGDLETSTEATAALTAQVNQLQTQLADCLAGNCPGSSAALPATGQTNCYNTTAGVVDCGSADFPGQDGSYQAGCPSEERFVDHGDDTVTDTCTGLMWQKNTAPGTYNWQNALKYCEDLSLSEYDDWRLPNVRELQSIVDYGCVDPSIDTTVFGAVLGIYWSSTSDVRFPDGAWLVNFGNGPSAYISVGGDGKGFFYYVRAVRSGP